MDNDWSGVLPNDSASKEERYAIRFQMDMLNSMSDEYSNVYHELPCECDAMVARSLLEEHISLLKSMLETAKETLLIRCLLGSDLLMDYY